MLPQKNPKRIIVTGGSGKLARHLRKFLPPSEEVIYLSRANIDYYSKEFEDLVSNADLLIHLAGKVFGSEQQLKEANEKLTERIVKVLPESTKLLFASSIAVYGKKAKNADERTPLNPDTPYAISKANCEEIVKTHSKYMILRIGTLYGEYFPQFAKMLRLIRKGIVPVFCGGQQRVPFTFADDVAKIMVRWKKGIFVVSDVGRPLYTYLNLAKELLNQKAIFIPIPKLIAKIILPKEAAESLCSDRTFNPKKAQEELGFEITPPEQGVRILVQRLKEIGKL